MALALACPACRGALRVAEDAVGKSAKCPHCGAVFAVCRPVVAVAAGAPPRQPPPAAPPDARVSARPGSGRPPLPPAAAPSLPAPEAVPPTPLDLALEEYLQEHLEPGEQVLWTGQPWGRLVRLEMLKWSLFGAALAAPALLVASLFLHSDDPAGKAVLACAGLLLVGTGAGLAGYHVVRCRNQGRYTGYVLTDRRALVVYRDPAGRKALRSFTAAEARFMYVRKSWLAPGGGHLIFHARQQTAKVVRIGWEKAVRRSTVESGFRNLAQVEQVERLAHALLVTPRAAPPEAAAPRPAPPHSPAPTAAPPPAQGPPSPPAAHAPGPEPVPAVPAAWQHRVNRELGTNEAVLWAGQPDRALAVLHGSWFPAGCLLTALLTWGGLVDLILKGFADGDGLGPYRWLFGWLAVGVGLAGLVVVVVCVLWTARRTLYVLTNRRALVWRPGFLGLPTRDEYRPHELTNTHFRQSWACAAGAGDVVFRTVRALKKVRTSYTTEMTMFGRKIRHGFLCLRQAAAVEQLVQTALVKPYLGKD